MGSLKDPTAVQWLMDDAGAPTSMVLCGAARGAVRDPQNRVSLPPPPALPSPCSRQGSLPSPQVGAAPKWGAEPTPPARPRGRLAGMLTWYVEQQDASRFAL